MLPSAQHCLARVVDDAVAMLHPFAPLACELGAVGPSESALAMLQALFEFANVTRPISPSHRSLPHHVALHPLAHVNAAVGKFESALAVDLVESKLAVVIDVGAGRVHAFAMFHPIQELALVCCAVHILFYAPPNLLVVRPVSLIGTAVDLDVPAVTLRLVVFPFALICVPIGGDEHAVSVRLGVYEISFELAPICPTEDTMAMPM
mmetsp:Transcript_34470/g.94893  ORF Transcript_34470/g.94893 Transcript_34470/m.94893 type:complete len:206 (+) Transcript_34470:222-839(+)